MRPGLLVAADGTTFRGLSVGADGIATGEIVFNTAMTGYQEVATDPSYAGQVVVMTSPHIGNYGVTEADDQAAHPHCSGFIVRSMARRVSNWRARGSFTEFMADHGVVVLSDVDTRRLTRFVRDAGAMPVAMGSGVTEAELAAAAAAAPSMTGLDLATGVSTPSTYEVRPETAVVARVVAIDLGMKRDIVERMVSRGVELTVVPASSTSAQILAHKPDGVFISNGPGDPEPLTAPIEALRGLLGKVPIFGICLGHQVLGLALGASTYKLPFGHHGGNHPVRRVADGRVEITSQNHGFAVDLWSLTDAVAPERSGAVTPDLLPGQVDSDFGVVVASHQNLNDGTLEGLECRDVDAFSVQYHPEAAPGPNDAMALFDRFVNAIATDGR